MMLSQRHFAFHRGQQLERVKKISKAGMMNLMVPFLPDLHYSTALWCKDQNFRAVYNVTSDLKGMQTSLLAPAEDQARRAL